MDPTEEERVRPLWRLRMFQVEWGGLALCSGGRDSWSGALVTRRGGLVWPLPPARQQKVACTTPADSNEHPSLVSAARLLRTGFGDPRLIG